MNRRSVRRTLHLLASASLVLGALGPASAAAASGDPERVAELIRRAGVERDRGDHERAAALFAKADRAAGGGSLPAVVGLCQANLVLERWDEAIAAAERWIDLAKTPEARAAGQHALGVALFHRASEERLRASGGGTGATGNDGEEAPGTASLRLAAEAFRLAEAGVTVNRHLTLLSLADTLVRLGEHAEALEVLDRYEATAPPPDPLAGELRCWSERAVADGDEPEELPDPEAPEDDREVTPPVKLHAPPPGYTERARQARVQGTVILQAIIDREGRVDCIRVLRGLEPSLDRAALDKVKTWRFEPARLDDRPVEVYYNLTVNFELRRRSG